MLKKKYRGKYGELHQNTGIYKKKNQIVILEVKNKLKKVRNSLVDLRTD